MNKLFLFLALSASLFAADIPIAHAQIRAFGDKSEVNAQIIQLNDAQQAIMSLVSGHIEKYYVEPGQKVKAHQKIARIDSIMLSEMTANYLSYKEQYKSLNQNYKASKKLYDKGMISMQKLNTQSINRDKMLAKIHTLQSQLQTLNIDTKKLQEATAEYILYAHSDGIINKVLQPLHSVIGEDTPIVSIVKDHAFFVKAYIPLRFANGLQLGQKGVINYNDKLIAVRLTQILPELDATTQRIIALFSINTIGETFYTNTYVPLTLYFNAGKKYVAVKKSALSFFQNEWVVFTPKSEHEVKEEDHDEHSGEEHEEHEGGEENEESEEVPYTVTVVDIITEDDEYIAVKGLNEGEKYVSGKSYYVKSLLLKSSLGEHGH